MIDKEQYDALQTKERKKLTYAKIMKAGISCGNCKNYGKINEKGERIPTTEEGADMCWHNFTNVSGPLGLRGARSNNAKNMYCGMEGRFFYPKSDEAAGIKDRADEKARLKAELKAELAAEAKAELEQAEADKPEMPGDEVLPVDKPKRGRPFAAKPGQG